MINMFKDKYLFHLIILISFFSDPFIWIMAITKDDRPASVVLILIALSFFLKNKLIIKPKDLIWMVAWAAVFMYINIHGMLMLDLQQIIQSYGYLFKMLFLLTVIYAIKKDFYKILHLFFKYNIIIMCASVVLFFLLAFGIELPSIEFTQGESGLLLDRNWLYPLGIVMDKMTFGSVVFNRISGLTDEPGQLALLITWMLVLNEFTLKSSLYRNSLILIGLFTLSIGFMVSLLLFTIYLLAINIKRPIQVGKVVMMVAIFSLLSYLSLPDSMKSYIDGRTFDRIERTNIEKDPRFVDIVYNFNALVKSDQILFGTGVSESSERSLTRDFGAYGLVSLVMRYLPLYLLLLLNFGKIKSLLILIIFINFLQRPGIHFIYQMMCLTFIYYSPLLSRYPGARFTNK